MIRVMAAGQVYQFIFICKIDISLFGPGKATEEANDLKQMR